MAIAVSSLTGGGNNKTAGTSFTTAAPGSGAAVGEVIIFAVALDNTSTTDGQTSEVTSVTDSAGNTYVKLGEFCNGQGSAAAGAVISVWMALVTTAFTGSVDTFTVNLANSVTAKAWTARAFTVGAGNSLRLAGTLQTLADDGADPGSMTISGLTSKEYLFVRASAGESNSTTGWTATNYTNFLGGQTSGGGAATNMLVRASYRVLTATGDTLDPSLASADWASVYFALEEYTPGPPTVVTRYVDAASTAGGDGTTTATSGANRAFASLNEALTALQSTDWVGTNQRPVIVCGGSTADTVTASPSSTWLGKLSPACYISIVGNQPSSLAVDTTKYRLTHTDAGCFGGLTNLCYVRISFIHGLITVGAGATGIANYAIINPGTNPGNIDVRLDSCRSECVSMSASRTSQVHGFWVDTGGTTGNKVTLTNCVAAGFVGAGATHKGFTATTSASSDVAWYNCTAYNCGRGFSSEHASQFPIAVNDVAASCADGYTGSFRTGSSHNASDIAADAPGTGPVTGTPTFVSAPSDLHLASGDTVCKDAGADLSADSRFAFSTDGDGVARTGTWDIGADEYVASGTTYTLTLTGGLDNTRMTGGPRVKVITSGRTSGSLGSSQLTGVIVRQAKAVKAGSLSGSGALVRRASKSFSGSTTPAGAVARQARRTLAGSLTPGPGTLTGRAGKVLSAALSTAGALVRGVSRSLGASLSPSGAVGRSTPKTLSGAVTPGAGTLTRSQVKTFAGSLTPSGALARYFLTRVLSGALSSSGSLVRTATRTLSGSAAPSGSLSRRANKTLSGSQASSGSLVAQARRVFSGSLTTAGALSAKTSKVLSGTLTAAASVVRVSTRTLSAALSAAGDLSRRTSRTEAGSLTPTGDERRSIPKTLSASLDTSGSLEAHTLLARTLSAALSPVGSIVRVASRTLSGSQGSSGDLSRRTQTTLAGAQASAGSVSRQTGKGTDGSLSASGAVSRSSERTLSASLDAAGSLVRLTRRSLAASLDQAGSLARQTRRSLSAALAATSGTLSRQTARNFAASLASSGSLVPEKVTNLFTKTVDGTLGLAGALSRTAKKTLPAALTTAGAVARRPARSASGTLAPQGQVARRGQRQSSGQLAPTGAVAGKKLVVLDAVFGPVGDVVRSVAKFLGGLLFPSGTLATQGQFLPAIEVSGYATAHDSVGGYVDCSASVTGDVFVS